MYLLPVLTVCVSVILFLCSVTMSPQKQNMDKSIQLEKEKEKVKPTPLLFLHHLNWLVFLREELFALPSSQELS